MKVHCTRPSCARPENYFADLDDTTTLKTTQQKYCTNCGMPLLLYGRYVPIKFLGRGGFGTAFLARDRHMPGMRKCVVKQFQPAGNLSPNQLEQAQKLFELEAEVLAQIGNQNDQIPDLFAFFPITVKSLQAGKQDQFFYLVQEYIDGQNLEEELFQKGKFSEDQVLEVLQEILKVLKFVHQRHIIHRDIKPSNIMRRRDGKLFLLDFGAVKQVTNAASGGAASSTGIYSLGFAPPEQMSGNQIFPSTDLYALAVTVLNLLTGEEPNQLFDAYTNQWKWRNLVTVSPQLANILDKMLQAAVNQRFQSADEVLAALSQPLVTSTVTSSSVSQQPLVKSQPNFSVEEILMGSAFSGFEGTLIGIAILNLLGNPLIALTGTVVILGMLIFAQTRRWIEKFDFLIIAGITLGIILFIPFFNSSFTILQITFFAVAGGLVSMAFTIIFRIIFNILSTIIK
jgi:serine/threonine protein kinase